MTGLGSGALGLGLGCLLVVVTVLLAIRGPGNSSVVRLRRSGGLPGHNGGPAPTMPSARATRIARGRTLGVIVGGVAVVGALQVTAGARPAVFSATAIVVGTTVASLLARRRSRLRSWELRAEVAQACSVLSAQVRIGQVPIEALRSAAQDCPVLSPAVRTAELGGDVASCWRAQSAEAGAAGLADLARGWELSAATGAELAVVLEQVSETLIADQTLGLVIASEAAAPRATGKVMAVLPLVGIALGYLMGGDPVAFLLSSPVGWACLLFGAVAACVGVAWMERIADHASAQV